jgi:hypothetical protein
VVCDWLIRFHADLMARHGDEPLVNEFAGQLRNYLRRAAPLREGDVIASD